MGATIIASVVARVVDEGVRRGLDPRALAAIVGPRPRLVADGRVAIDAAYRCFALCLETTRDPAFPLAVARSVSVEDYSVLGFASLTSPSVEVVFERMVRYGHLITDSGAWQTRRTAAHLELTWVRAGRRTLGHRAANECAVAEFVGGLRAGFGARATPLRVHFRHPAPADPRGVHAAHFGAPIVWESTRDGADLDPALLAARPSGENAALSRYFMGILERSADLHAAYTDRVRALLLDGLPSGPPTSARIARDLGVSERSLRRALAAEGTTYRKVLDELRRDAALELLEQKRTVTETAFLLGFSETSALSRAFRRWYGTTTRQRARRKKAP